jgi:hypothetical protein
VVLFDTPAEPAHTAFLVWFPFSVSFLLSSFGELPFNFGDDKKLPILLFSATNLAQNTPLPASIAND